MNDESGHKNEVETPQNRRKESGTSHEEDRGRKSEIVSDEIIDDTRSDQGGRKSRQSTVNDEAIEKGEEGKDEGEEEEKEKELEKSFDGKNMFLRFSFLCGDSVLIQQLRNK